MSRWKHLWMLSKMNFPKRFRESRYRYNIVCRFILLNTNIERKAIDWKYIGRKKNRESESEKWEGEGEGERQYGFEERGWMYFCKYMRCICVYNWNVLLLRVWSFQIQLPYLILSATIFDILVNGIHSIENFQIPYLASINWPFVQMLLYYDITNCVWHNKRDRHSIA